MWKLFRDNSLAVISAKAEIHCKCWAPACEAVAKPSELVPTVLRGNAYRTRHKRITRLKRPQVQACKGSRMLLARYAFPRREVVAKASELVPTVLRGNAYVLSTNV